ncbi:MAG: hypothetical protein ACKOGA_24410, partial [Planctomycetaceae bacterium]
MADNRGRLPWPARLSSRTGRPALPNPLTPIRWHKPLAQRARRLVHSLPRAGRRVPAGAAFSTVAVNFRARWAAVKILPGMRPGGECPWAGGPGAWYASVRR